MIRNKKEQYENIKNILQETNYSNRELQTALAIIFKYDREEVFVLDGLDEYSSKNKEKLVIPKLLDRKLLPRLMIIVFCHPSAIC